MQTGKILASAITGTSAMKLFSYLISKSENRNYLEPEILSQLIKRLPIKVSKGSSEVTGWLAHYVMGTLFVAFYHELWKRENIKPSLISGALIGAASGLVGVSIWEIVFKIHPNPPAKNLKKYFGHLILAHIVFGVFSSLSYKLADSAERKE